MCGASSGYLSSQLQPTLYLWYLLCRLLRAKNILRPVERPPKPATRVPSKALFGRLQTEAFRFLVRPLFCHRLWSLGPHRLPHRQLDHRPIAFVLVDVRASEEVADSPSSLLGIMTGHEIVNVPGEQPTCNPRAGTPCPPTLPSVAQRRSWRR